MLRETLSAASEDAARQRFHDVNLTPRNNTGQRVGVVEPTGQVYGAANSALALPCAIWAAIFGGNCASQAR